MCLRFTFDCCQNKVLPVRQRKTTLFPCGRPDESDLSSSGRQSASQAALVTETLQTVRRFGAQRGDPSPLPSGTNSKGVALVYRPARLCSDSDQLPPTQPRDGGDPPLSPERKQPLLLGTADVWGGLRLRRRPVIKTKINASKLNGRACNRSCRRICRGTCPA